MNRTYRQRAAPRGRRRRRGIRAQHEQGVFGFAEKVARNTLVRSVAKKGVEYSPGIYHNHTKRKKNETLKNNFKFGRCPFSFEQGD